MMGTRGPRPIEAHHFILHGLRRGDFVSLSEAAKIAGVSGQRVGQWAKAARINWKARRRAAVRAAWRMELNRQRMKDRGVTPQRPTKAQMREATARLLIGKPITVLPPSRL
jgi:hypothetical protein